VKELETAAPLIPPRPTIKKPQAVAASCKACHLWENATQTVFGEGKLASTVMFIGEQPGDKEDLSGHPFVGPAGALLDEALLEAGIDRTKVYVTNVVKHFKWEPRGKRRIPQEAERCGNRSLPSLARGRDCRRQTASNRLSRGDRCTGRHQSEVPRLRAARAIRRIQSRSSRHRHGAPVVDPSRND
jgi:hypothetical protein